MSVLVRKNPTLDLVILIAGVLFLAIQNPCIPP